MTRKQPKRTSRPGVDAYGRNPLHYAALEGNVNQVRQLLATGSNPNAADDDGWSPLHVAAQSGATEVVRILLEMGATVDPRDSHGNTPLSKAVFNSRGNGDVIKLLRGAGADPYAENLHGVSPLGLARSIANYDVKQYFSNLPELKTDRPS
jgi:ankyrin repeat protein